ncbi:hypothetical protein MD484_g5613, partial [Candolleomyces efflorescens]
MATTAKVAAAPFDDENADIVLRTSDNVDFRVFKIILSYASPFFKTMFSLPSPAAASRNDNTSQDADSLKQISPPSTSPDPPVVDVQESSEVIRIILECCYPMDRPPIPDLQLAWQVLEASEKYELASVERYVKPIFRTFIPGDPLRCFAVAGRNHWKEELELAARTLLHQPLPFPYVKEIRQISGDVYHQLIDYHRKCGVAAERAISHVQVVFKVLSVATDAASEYTFFSCAECRKAVLNDQDPVFRDSVPSGTLNDAIWKCLRSTSQWFQEFVLVCQFAVRDQPLPTPSTSEGPFKDLINQYLYQAQLCSRCRVSASKQLPLFVDRYFVPLATQAVAEVALDFRV